MFANASLVDCTINILREDLKRCLFDKLHHKGQNEALTKHLEDQADLKNVLEEKLRVLEETILTKLSDYENQIGSVFKAGGSNQKQ